MFVVSLIITTVLLMHQNESFHSSFYFNIKYMVTALALIIIIIIIIIIKLTERFPTTNQTL